MAARAKQRAAYGLLALAVNVASQGAETVSSGGSWAPRPGRMQGPELPLTDEHAWQFPPLPFPGTAEAPPRTKSGTRLLRARAGHVGAR